MKKIKRIIGIFSIAAIFGLSGCGIINNNSSINTVEIIEDNNINIEEIINEDVSNIKDSSTDEITSLDLEDPDFFELTNEIQTKTILSNVRIEANYYSSFRGRYQLQASSIGSGVIIKEEEIRGKNYYYALTNNHVVYNAYSYATYVVEDVYETEYQATLIYSLNTYDLALIRFESNEDLYVVELEDKDVYSGYVAAIGEANAKSNSLTYGYITGVEEFTPSEDEKDESYVNFDVITHNAYIEPGSSGGALLDMNLKLIGINFASHIDEDSNWEYSYAIPLSKILEFIELCNEKTGFSLY